MSRASSNEEMGRTILQVGAFPFPSHQGSQVYVSGMCRGLAQRGWRVRLAAYGYGQGRWPDGVEAVPMPRLELGSLASGPQWSKVGWNSALVAALVLEIRRGVDVIHAHNVEAPLLAWTAMRLARRRVPLVYNLHTSLEEELPVYVNGRRRGRWAADVGGRVDRLLPQMSDACVAISRRAETQLEGWGARDVVHVPPAVDMSELQGGDAARARQRWGLGEGPWVVYAGNTDAYQDLDDLFRAMATVSEGGLLLVTGSPSDPVEQAARAAGIDSARLRVIHSRDFADTLDALAVGAVGVLPRKVCTGFPIKLLNQLGCGLVTVAAAGSAQPIEGVIPVPNGDVSAMASAIRAVLSEPNMARRLGEGARRTIAARYSWRTASRALEPLYERLVRG